MRYGFVIDQRKCIGCHACTTACKSEHDVPLGVFRTWVKSVEKGSYPNTRRHFLVQRCNHCEDAPCVNICPTKALYKRSDGIVDFNKDSCIGCKSCMGACPYEAIYIDPATATAAKCNFCAHRVEVGLQPACVIVCPEQAIISGDLEDPTSQISRLIGRENVQVRKPEKNTKPQLFYLGADQVAVNPEATPDSVGYMWGQPNTHLHGREIASAPVVPSYRPLDFQTLLGSAADSGAATLPPPKAVTMPVAGQIKPFSTVPPVAGRTPIPLANIQTPSKVVSSGEIRSGTSMAGGLLAQGVDAQVNYNVSHERPWGFLVSLYLWTKSIGAGVFLVTALAIAFGLANDSFLLKAIAPIIGLAFVGLTTLLLVADLKHPERFLYILTRPNWSSWLVWGAVILIGYSGILVLWLVARFFGWSGLEPVLLVPGVVLAAMSAVYSAFLFAQAKGRDLWQSPLLAPHLLVQALVAGSAVLSIGGIVTGAVGTTLNFLSVILLSAVIINALLMLGEGSVTHINSSVGRAAHDMYFGSQRNKFWWGAVMAGIIIPLILLAIALSGGIFWLSAVAAVLALVGLLAYEDSWIIAGQSVPLS
jgi:Fe-S-cluster-containing dehydrogenase component/formate-dependent nitrite reductase membrane component NrfD